MITGLLALFLLTQNPGLYGQDIPRTLYVLNGLGRTVSKMNLDSGDISNDVVTVGSVPNRILTNGEFVYVVNSVPPGITVIDGKTDAVVQNIALADGSNPWDMAFVGADRAYVTNLLANTVTVLDLANGDSVKSIPVGEGPEGILVVNNTAYVANTGNFPDYDPSTVSVIDIRTDSVTKTLAVPTNPQDLALGPDGNIYVVCTGNFGDIGGKIAVINPFADTDFTPLVVDTVEIGGSPGDIEITTGGMVYLPDFGDGTNGFLYAYDVFAGSVINDATNPILVGNGAMQVFFDASTGALYVNNFSDDAVQQLNAVDATVQGTFAFGDGAQQVAILEAIRQSDPWADGVAAFTPGDGAGFGQNFFPENVLGPPDPDPTLSEVNPTAKPQEVLSLGHGGEIILEFSDNVIVDEAGADFTVFENVFLNSFDNNKPFIEAAFVAVSMDGINFVEFPWDTTTWAGFAGVTPTRDNQNPTDPAVSGGDSFDLADVGLPYARFVKLTDIGDLKQEGDFNGDFDLDAIVAVNSAEQAPTSVAGGGDTQPPGFSLAQNYPNPFNPVTRIDFTVAQAANVALQVYNLKGQLVRTLLNQSFLPGTYSTMWDGTDRLGRQVATGVYVYKLKVGGRSLARRLTVIR